MKTYRKDKRGLDSVKIPTDLDIAWSAGIFEGEGSICRSGGRNYTSFTASVCQKDPDLLYRLRELWGGSINCYANRGGGLVDNKERNLELFRWSVCGDRARLFLASIYLYLTPRRKNQIDKTSAREWLDFVGELPIAENSSSSVHNRLSQILISYISAHREAAEQQREEYLRQYHEERKKNDPNYMERRRNNTRAWRKRHQDVAVSTTGTDDRIVQFRS
jgi:hypothetical protein